MFWLRNKKNKFSLRTLNLSSVFMVLHKRVNQMLWRLRFVQACLSMRCSNIIRYVHASKPINKPYVAMFIFSGTCEPLKALKEIDKSKYC